MFLSLFGRSSRSGTHEHWENHRLRINETHLRVQVAKFLAAYVTESSDPDCEPGRRFRAQLPCAVAEYCATREEAEDLLRAVIAPDVKDLL